MIYGMLEGDLDCQILKRFIVVLADLNLTYKFILNGLLDNVG